MSCFLHISFDFKINFLVKLFLLFSIMTSSLLLKSFIPGVWLDFLFLSSLEKRSEAAVSPWSKFFHKMFVNTSTFKVHLKCSALLNSLLTFFFFKRPLVRQRWCKVKWINLNKIERKICRDFNRQLYGGIFQGGIWKYIVFLLRRSLCLRKFETEPPWTIFFCALKPPLDNWQPAKQYIFQFCKNTFWQIHWANWTNTFINLDKYML